MDIETAAQKIRVFFYKKKRLPSYSEMCSLFNFSSKKASFYLAKKLISAGILAKDSSGKLIPKKFFPSLPVLGIIKAGNPSPAEEQLMESMSFENYLVSKPHKSYILKVSGDSMIEAGINEGDLVVVEKDKQPKNDDIVVAFIDNEFTLKYLKNQNGKTFLSAANNKYPPFFPKENLSIFGVVVSVIRKYY